MTIATGCLSAGSAKDCLFWVCTRNERLAVPHRAVGDEEVLIESLSSSRSSPSSGFGSSSRWYVLLISSGIKSIASTDGNYFGLGYQRNPVKLILNDGIERGRWAMNAIAGTQGKSAGAPPQPVSSQAVCRVLGLIQSHYC